MVSHSKLKTFTLPSTPPHPVILRGAEGEVAESINQQRALALLKGGAVADAVWEQGKSTFSLPLIRLDGNLFPREMNFLRSNNSRFCNSGQALRAEWHEGEVRVKEESGSFYECCEELHSKIHFCLILNRWINQKLFHTASIQRQNTEHQSITNRRCINHWSLQRAPFKNIKHRIIPKSNTQSIN